MMSGSSVESVWIPTYSTGLRLDDLPRKSSGITRGLRQAQAASVCHQLPALTVSRPSKSRITAERGYITAASVGLNFDDDVVRERCFQVDPFNSQFTTSLNRTRRISSRRCRTDIRYLNKPVDSFSYLKPVKPAKSVSVKSESVVVSGAATRSEPADTVRRGSGEVSSLWRKSSTTSDVRASERENDVEWDECLVMKLSANTARWLAQNPATTEDARNRLHKVLDTVHGAAVTGERVQLVKEYQSETNAVSSAKTVEKPWLSGKDMCVFARHFVTQLRA